MSHNGCHLLLSAFELLAQLSNFCLKAIPPSARRTKVVFQLPFPALQNATLLNDLRMALPRALKVVVQIVLHAIKACGSGPRFDQLVLEIADMILHGVATSRETITFELRTCQPGLYFRKRIFQQIGRLCHLLQFDIDLR